MPIKSPPPTCTVRWNIILVLLTLFFSPDSLSAQIDCGVNDITDAEFDQMLSAIDGNSNKSNLGVTTNYSVPIHLTIMNKALNTPPKAYPVEQMQVAIAEINEMDYFGGITFYLCDTSIVNDPNYFDFTLNAGEFAIASTYNQPDVLNVYLFESGTNWATSVAFIPNLAAVLMTSTNSKILAHEIGHYLGLAHTFNSTTAGPPLDFVMLRPDNSYNTFVDPDESFCLCGTDCICTGNNSGDRISDTDVDPGLSFCGNSPTAGCSVTHTAPSGSTLTETYTPDANNLMSYYAERTHFSQGQITRMQDVLVTFASNVANNSGNNCITFPDPDVIGVTEGAIFTPFYDESTLNHDYTPLEDFAIRQEDFSSTVEGHRKSDTEGDYSIIRDVAYLAEDKDVRVGQEEAVNAQSILLGNANFDVNTLDLIEIQRHLLGVAPIQSSYAKIAADVNNSGNISTLDMIGIMRFLLGINTDFDSTPDFKVVPKYALGDALFEAAFFQDPFAAVWNINGEQRGYLDNAQSGDISYLSPITFNLNIPEAKEKDTWTFHVVKTGDADLSLADVQNLQEDNSTDIVFSNASHPCIPAGTSLTVEAKTTAQLNDIDGFQLGLEVDDTHLNIKGVQEATLQPLTNDNMALKDNGGLVVAWVNPQLGQTIPNTSIDIFKLQLQSETQVCNLSDHFSLNEELLQSMFIADGDTLPIGQLNIELVPVTTAQALTLGSVFPNPFSNQVTIPFTLTSSKSVKLTVYDGFGYWHTEETHFSTGQHQFQLSQGLTQLPSGRVLYFDLETEDQVVFGSFIKQ